MTIDETEIDLINLYMEITENSTENKTDYESGRFNHELVNEYRKSQYKTKGNFNMLKSVVTIERFIFC